MNQQIYKDIISGKQSGITATSLRTLLAGAGIGYHTFMCMRNYLYDWSIKKTRSVDAVVLSVGNLTTGGTGKTPLVIWLCQYIQSQKKSCAILTRGYKNRHQNKTPDIMPHDELAEFKACCPDIPVIVNPDRVAGANTALEQHQAQVLILDDGFQHRGMARDLDIVTIDATLPFGYGRIFPAGLLREPVDSIRRAHAAILTRCDQVGEDQLCALESQLLGIHSDIIVCRSVHKPYALINMHNTELEMKNLQQKRVLMFCGIGQPDAFKKTLQSLGAHVVECDIANDHHHYTRHDLDRITRLADTVKADICITTQKNWPSVSSCRIPEGHSWAFLQIRFEFLLGRDALIQLIDRVLTSKISPDTDT